MLQSAPLPRTAVFSRPRALFSSHIIDARLVYCCSFVAAPIQHGYCTCCPQPPALSSFMPAHHTYSPFFFALHRVPRHLRHSAKPSSPMKQHSPRRRRWRFTRGIGDPKQLPVFFCCRCNPIGGCQELACAGPWQQWQRGHAPGPCVCYPGGHACTGSCALLAAPATAFRPGLAPHNSRHLCICPSKALAAGWATPVHKLPPWHVVVEALPNRGWP